MCTRYVSPEAAVVERRWHGAPWSLAGLWTEWVDPETGESHLSCTMLTQNADHHDLMKRMHTPDPKRPPDAQDKRGVIPLAPDEVNAWLFEQATALIRPAPVAWFDAGPQTPPPGAQGTWL